MTKGAASEPQAAQEPSKVTLSQLAGLLLVLVISWILWSGIYKPLVLGLGLFSCCLSLYLAHRMGFFRHTMPLRSLQRIPGFWLWLLRDIIKSSLDVARVVLSRSLDISPSVVELDCKEDSEVARVLLGNSITLSPGTVTIDLHGGKLLVHCLTRASALQLEEQAAHQRIRQLKIP
jgi:multicomponent Na+:H+ antiporter subunit E